MSTGAARRPVRAFVGLGSNLESPLQQLRDALLALAEIPDSFLLRVSAFYRTPPMGPQDQPDYLNAAACLETTLTPITLLDELQAIEKKQGRKREGERWGARTLDLDLLLYDDQRIDEPRLQVPHPGIAERIFVLKPLADIAPQLVIPAVGDVASLLQARADDAIEQVDV